MELGLKGKIALVSGASKGLGYAVARALSAEGAQVSISSRDEQAIGNAARQIEQETGMPYRRGGFALTPPSLVVFLISIVLALIALLVRYAHVSVPIISSARIFDVLAIAYVVLVIGVLFRGI